jgi:hypothetical protein
MAGSRAHYVKCGHTASIAQTRRWGWILPLFLLLFLGRSGNGADSVNNGIIGFEVRGRLLITYFDDAEQVANNYETTFSALCGDCEVLIQTKGYGSTSLEYWEFGADPTNSYFLEKFRDIPVTNMVKMIGRSITNVPLKSPRLPDNAATIELEARRTPSMRGAIIPIWLAYASGCYLAERAPGERVDSMFQLGDPRFQRHINEYAFWRWADNTGEFIAEFHCTRDDKYWQQAARYEGVITNAVYRVLSWTNARSRNLPAEFELKVYAPDARKSRRKLSRLTAKVVGRTDTITFLESNRFSLLSKDTPPRTRVVDMRVTTDVRGREPLIYLTRDGKIKPYDEAVIIAEDLTANRPGTRRYEAAQVHRRSAFDLRLLLSVVAAMPISLAMIAWLKRDKKKPNKTIQHNT